LGLKGIICRVNQGELQGEYEVEEIDRLLENLQEAHRQIEEFRKDTIEVTELYLLSSVVLEVLDWTNTAYGDKSLSINPSLLVSVQE
jgi:hypothetical protein